MQKLRNIIIQRRVARVESWEYREVILWGEEGKVSDAIPSSVATLMWFW